MDVNEYLPGSGAIASQLDAEIVSVMLLPVGNAALAAPAQQSNKMRASESDLSSNVWIADHLVHFSFSPHSKDDAEVTNTQWVL